MRAFQAAKNANTSKSSEKGMPLGALGSLSGDDYIDRSEFRLLLAYLRQYFELYLMFTSIDGKSSVGDRTINIDEFEAAIPQVGRPNAHAALRATRQHATHPQPHTIPHHMPRTHNLTHGTTQRHAPHAASRAP